ncbi:MAG: serine/threonine protein kinase [Burkholderiaceae bacterium]
MHSSPSPDPALQTPFSGLTPAVVLDALDSVGLASDGRIFQLNSYENRVFQVFLSDGRAVVTKFYRPNRWTDSQILEEHSFSAELAAEEIPIAAPWELEADTGSAMQCTLIGAPATLARISTPDGDYRFSVTERKAGRAPELEHADTLEWIGRFVGRMHAVGARKPFAVRRSLTLDEFGWGCRDWLLEHGNIPPEIAPQWKAAVDAALTLASQGFERLPDIQNIRLHGDCHAGNVLWTDAGPHFVDLDDCLTGPAVQDLWMLLSGDPTAARVQMRSLLTGYEQFMDFDDRQLALIEPLRTLRMVHQSAWLAKRWSDPAFPPSFPWFASGAYWQQSAQQLLQQVEQG